MLYRFEILRDIRDRKLLTNGKIAQNINRSESAVSKTLNGVRCGKETIRLIAEYLGVPIERLARGRRKSA